MFLIRLGFCFVLLCFTNLTTAAYFFHFLAHIFPLAAVTHVYSEVLFLWGNPSPWGHTSEEQVLDWGWREGEPYLPAVSISWAQQRWGWGGLWRARKAAPPFPPHLRPTNKAGKSTALCRDMLLCSYNPMAVSHGSTTGVQLPWSGCRLSEHHSPWAWRCTASLGWL